MINRVVLIGRLTKDPDLRYTQSGIAVTSFTLAVNRNFANQQGEREADFIPVVVWRGAAESCAKHLAKGRLVAITGRIQTRSYEQDGQKRYTWEVVADEVQFIDWGEKAQGQTQNNAEPTGFSQIDNNGELPF